MRMAKQVQAARLTRTVALGTVRLTRAADFDEHR